MRRKEPSRGETAGGRWVASARRRNKSMTMPKQCKPAKQANSSERLGSSCGRGGGFFFFVAAENRHGASLANFWCRLFCARFYLSNNMATARLTQGKNCSGPARSSLVRPAYKNFKLSFSICMAPVRFPIAVTRRRSNTGVRVLGVVLREPT